MWSHVRWLRAAFTVVLLGAASLTWAALGAISQTTGSPVSQATCGCEQVNSEFGAQVASSSDIGESGDDVSPLLDAQERLPDGTVVEWVTHEEQQFVGSYPGAMYVFTGRSEGTVSAGNCGSGPRQHVVIIIPGNGDLGSKQDVIVTRVGEQTENISEIAPGTRVGSIDVLGTCGGSGEYQKWRGIVE